jgi:hypothetical protein
LSNHTTPSPTQKLQKNATKISSIWGSQKHPRDVQNGGKNTIFALESQNADPPASAFLLF